MGPVLLAGFAQWKDMLQLLLACEEAPLRTRTALYVHFLSALCAQLQHSLGTVRGKSGMGFTATSVIPDALGVCATICLPRWLNL